MSIKNLSLLVCFRYKLKESTILMLTVLVCFFPVITLLISTPSSTKQFFVSKIITNFAKVALLEGELAWVV